VFYSEQHSIRVLLTHALGDGNGHMTPGSALPNNAGTYLDPSGQKRPIFQPIRD
jgi:hypothetical protein